MNRKTFFDRDFRDYLNENGINILTSEADGLGMRVLCDLDRNGEDILSDVLGGVSFEAPAWNDGVSSVMLFREMIRPLVIYAIFRDGADIVIDVQTREGSYVADYLMALYDVHRTPMGDIDWYDGELTDTLNRVRSAVGDQYRVITRSGTARGGFRNRHEFSGREI